MKYFHWSLLIFPILLFVILRTIIFFGEYYDNDGVCNLILGPSESSLVWASLLTGLYSYSTNRIITKRKSKTEDEK